MNASSFLSDVEDKRVVDVPVTDIVPVDVDPTTLTDQACRDLVAEVGAQGVPEPVCLTPDAERDRPPRGVDTSRGASRGDVRIPQGPPYRVIHGQRLVSAAEEAGVEEVPAVVYTAQEVEAQVARLIGRCRRAEKPLKRAELYDALARIGGLSATQVARRVGVGRRTVYRYLSLLDFPDGLRRPIRDEDLTVFQALACAKAPRGKIEPLVRAVLKHGLSTRVIRELVSRVERFPETPVSVLAEEVAATRTSGQDPRPGSRQAQAAEGKTPRPPQGPFDGGFDGLTTPLRTPPTEVQIDHGRYTEQLSDERREALEQMAEDAQLDGIVVRRAALLILGSSSLPTPGAVGYAQLLDETELGRGLTQMELGLERIRAASEEGLTPSLRKVASLVISHVMDTWGPEILEIVEQAPTAVRVP